MTPKTIRSFAAGLLVAVSVTTAAYYIQADQATDASALSETELRAALADAGYKVEKAKEWETLETDLEKTKTALAETEAALKEVKDKKNDDKKDEDKKDEDKKDDEKKDDDKHTVVIEVKPGMTGGHIAQALKEEKIIDDALAFSKKVEDKGVADQLKPQKTEVSSDMSLDELVDAFF
ncbi:hypothetical protein [Shouchella lonarensis]|uniref:YceG-like family protein n=1 Tax=Shouchella lonarensis TaxID=1464122 RepID=A0A1G6KPV8_9BACI|nr:hypothetical protein [Shouchella lonarensis]SDC33129.1 hypothetical protein SAMN05421737_107112 [Shouchella lonarensis]